MCGGGEEPSMPSKLFGCVLREATSRFTCWHFSPNSFVDAYKCDYFHFAPKRRDCNVDQDGIDRSGLRLPPPTTKTLKKNATQENV